MKRTVQANYCEGHGRGSTSSIIKANCTASALKGLKISARDEAAAKGYKKDGQTSKLRGDRKDVSVSSSRLIAHGSSF